MKLTLEAWGKREYGEHVPCRVTLQRWAREGKIQPLPEKHGREYFVEPQARYVNNKPSKLLRRIYGTTPPRSKTPELAR